MDTSCPTKSELNNLGAGVDQALRLGSARDLPVIGFGEVTSVIAWPPDDARWAIKLLPPFKSSEQLMTYRTVVDRYIGILADRGVTTVPTSVVEVAGDTGFLRAFMVQPLGRLESLLSRVLVYADSNEATRLLEQLVDIVVSVVDPHTGLDAQVSNWIINDDGSLTYLDVTTPLIRDDSGLTLDASLVCSIYPAFLRPVLLRFVFPSIAASYHDAKSVLVDIGSNLYRERLDRHIPRLIEIASSRGIHLDPQSLWRHHRADSRMWRVMSGLKTLDRAWNRRVRRRLYPFLLPERSHD